MTSVHPNQSSISPVLKVLLAVGAVVTVASLAIIAGFILVFLSR
jgi:hypothetical protein